MSSPENETPQCLNIDVEQWRREIRMFSESTQKALEAIVSDLSNSCSNAESSAPGRTPLPGRTKADTVDGDRLASLKEQIAQRLNQ